MNDSHMINDGRPGGADRTGSTQWSTDRSGRAGPGNGNETLRLAIIYGSTREGRLCDKVADWVASQVAGHRGFEVDLIDPLLLDLPPRHGLDGDGAAVSALRQRIADADAFIVVTPEYNHGYPAALKQLIDSVGKEWQAKPVAFASYGGISGGLRAVEQLRQVFAELHAVTIRDGVSFPDVWNLMDGGNRLQGSRGAIDGAARMLAQLRWWARTLRDARATSPYGLLRT
jgi:NAD(P)H-dependent FMN reductase